MKSWFFFPIALLMLSPIWLERMESRVDGIAEGGAAFPTYSEGGAAFPTYAEGGAAFPTR